MNLRAQAIHGMALLAAATLAHAAPFGYVVNSDFRGEENIDSLYRVDLATGDADLIGPVGYADVEGLALSPGGVLYGVDDATKTLIVIDTDTGQGEPVGGADGNTGLPTGIENSRDFGLTFDAQGTLWLSSDVTGQIWRLNPGTGQPTLVFGSPDSAPTTGSDGAKSADNPGALTGLAACGGQVSGIGSTGDERYYAVPGDGAGPDLIGALHAGLSFGDGGLDYDADGTLWGVADRSTDLSGAPLDQPSIIFTLDPDTGAATRTATTVIGVEALAIAPPSATCAARQAGAPRIPTLSGAGLAALLLSLFGVGALALRQRGQALNFLSRTSA